MTKSDSEDEPPFPWMAMSSICVGMLAHSVVFTSPLPYVAFMVVDFGMAKNVDLAGYSAGWITGAFMIGRTIASIPWGIASDNWGRRPCLILSMFNIAVIGILFGFSNSFAMAIILRFLIGLGNGFMCVAKTCVSEIVETKEHEMIGFGYLNSIWGLGLIVGPVLGGLLSRISVQYPGSVSKDSLWAKFPYLLPCLVCAFFAVIAGVWVYFCLPETLGEHKVLLTNEEYVKRKREAREALTSSKVEEEEGDVEMVSNPMRIDSSSKLVDGHVTSNNNNNSSGKSKWSIGFNKSKKSKQIKSGGFQALPSDDIDENVTEEVSEVQEISDVESLVSHIDSSNNISDEEEDMNSNERNKKGGYKRVDIERIEDEEASPTSITETEDLNNDYNTEKVIVSSGTSTVPSKPKTIQEILYNWDIRIMFMIYMTLCFVVIFIDECFPLWALTSLEKGGLAWESAQVGAVLACVGGALVLFQFLFYQPVMKAYFPHGPTDTYVKLCNISAINVLLVPFGAYFGASVLPTNTPEQSQSNYVLFFSVVFFLMIYRISAGASFTTLGIVVNNSVDQSMRGTMNGLIMTAGSLGNGVGPIVGSICYAFSLSLPQIIPLIPLDGRIVFGIGALMSVLLGLFAKKFMVVN